MLADALAECPETSKATDWNFDITTFVGFDEYPARNVCSYEVSYETSCGQLRGPGPY